MFDKLTAHKSVDPMILPYQNRFTVAFHSGSGSNKIPDFIRAKIERTSNEITRACSVPLPQNILTLKKSPPVPAQMFNALVALIPSALTARMRWGDIELLLGDLKDHSTCRMFVSSEHVTSESYLLETVKPLNDFILSAAGLWDAQVILSFSVDTLKESKFDASREDQENNFQNVSRETTSAPEVFAALAKVIAKARPSIRSLPVEKEKKDADELLKLIKYIRTNPEAINKTAELLDIIETKNINQAVLISSLIYEIDRERGIPTGFYQRNFPKIASGYIDRFKMGQQLSMGPNKVPIFNIKPN